MVLETLTRPLLRAVGGLTTPLLPDDYLELVDPLLSTRRLWGRVVERLPRTADATELVIRPGVGWTGHRPGQWMPVGVRVDGAWHTRSYSLTSVPGRAVLCVTVKAVPGGRVSPYLVHDAPVGTLLRLGPAQGDLAAPPGRPGDPSPLLLLTGGSGITPALGILRAAWAADDDLDVVHVHCARDADDVIGGAELRRRSAAGRGYVLREHHDAVSGLFDPGDLDELCPDWTRRTALACGPAGMLDAVEAHWAWHDLADRLLVERFAAPAFASPGAAGGTVTFARSRRSADAVGGTPLLVVGEDAGVDMPSGCRMGICFACATTLVSGQVRDLRTGAVHGEPGDRVQPCVSAAAGPCVLDR